MNKRDGQKSTSSTKSWGDSAVDIFHSWPIVWGRSELAYRCLQRNILNHAAWKMILFCYKLQEEINPIKALNKNIVHRHATMYLYLQTKLLELFIFIKSNLMVKNLYTQSFQKKWTYFRAVAWSEWFSATFSDFTFIWFIWEFGRSLVSITINFPDNYCKTVYFGHSGKEINTLFKCSGLILSWTSWHC
jgi:hypothetical protein